jgi:hypothetical protein
VRQQPGETLRAFIYRFTKVRETIPRISDASIIIAFCQGSVTRRCWRSCDTLGGNYHHLFCLGGQMRQGCRGPCIALCPSRRACPDRGLQCRCPWQRQEEQEEPRHEQAVVWGFGHCGGSGRGPELAQQAPAPTAYRPLVISCSSWGPPQYGRTT